MVHVLAVHFENLAPNPPHPPASSKLSIIPRIKPGLCSPVMTRSGMVFSAHRQEWRICLITLDPSCSLLLNWVETGKLETSFFFFLFGKERKLKYTNVTANAMK